MRSHYIRNAIREEKTKKENIKKEEIKADKINIKYNTHKINV